MHNRKRLFISWLAFILILALFISFRSFWMVYLVHPIALLLWALWRVITSVNQGIYWTVLILVCLVIAFRLLPPESRPSPGVMDPYHYHRPDRVEYWKSLMDDGLAGMSGRAVLRERMRKMLLSVLAQTERSNPVDLASLVESGQVTLPPGAERYLLPEGDESGKTHVAGGRFAFNKMLDRLRQRLSGGRHADEESISETLSWMESRMEMHHDR